MQNTLITDLGLILSTAAITTIIFKKLKQPLVLGYIIAGFLVGTNFKFFPTVSDANNIKIWADIGVVFLLFGLGLEFSFKKLLHAGGKSALTASIEITAILLIGYFVGRLLGWSEITSLFFGGILSIASTTIIIRTFDELGVKSRKFSDVVLGILIIEDLAAVVLLVLLSTVAISNKFEGGQILFTITRLGFFLIVWFLSGIFFIPTLLKKISSLLNDETLLIISIALCLVMVLTAHEAGFSEALGAFVMGSVLAETEYSHKIEHLLKPVKDLFGAVFFVSVGMLLNIEVLQHYFLPIIIGVLILLIAKPLFVTIGSVISGEAVKTSVQAGMSLSQIGEFSFIIATLGVSLKVTDNFLYPIAVAISVITTFTTPYMVKLSSPVFELMEKKMLPKKLMNRLTLYGVGMQSISTVSNWQKILRTYFKTMIIQSVIIIAISVFSLRFIKPLFVQNHWSSIFTVVISLMMIAPFIWALAVKKIEQQSVLTLWMQKKFRGPLILLQTGRIALAIFFIFFLAGQLLSTLIAVIVVVFIVLILVIFSKKIQTFYYRIETRFLSNFNNVSVQEHVHLPNIAPWDAHIAEFKVAANASVIGKTLLQLQLRERFGVNIATIERGDEFIMAPNKNEEIFPGDTLFVIGSDEQLQLFRTYLNIKKTVSENAMVAKKAVGLKPIVIPVNSVFIGKKIRDSYIREITKGIVVGLERNGERILNPDSSIMIEEGDVIWIAGNERRLKVLSKRQGQNNHAENEK